MSYDSRLERLEGQWSKRQPVACKPIRIIHTIIEPDRSVSGIVVEAGKPAFRIFDRLDGESVEDLERRVYQAMGWGQPRI